MIFVAGAWHTEFHIRPITPYLEAYGYRVVPTKLRPSSRHDPPPTIQDNIQQIRDVLKAGLDAGYHVCLLGQSLAGQFVAAAASEFLATATAEERSRFLHIAFTACLLSECVPSNGGAQWYTIDSKMMWATVDLPYETFYNSMSPKQLRNLWQC